MRTSCIAVAVYIAPITTLCMVIEFLQIDWALANSDGSSCALILRRNPSEPTGGHLKHREEPDEICISYEDIDGAIDLAREKTRFVSSLNELSGDRSTERSERGKHPPEVSNTRLELNNYALDLSGHLNMIVTKLIREQYDLSRAEIINRLPLIDMSKSKLWPTCPLVVRAKDFRCEPSRYRSFTGHCNNLEHPTWGAAMTNYKRYLAPAYQDAISQARKSVVMRPAVKAEGHRARLVVNHELPLSRVVSSTVHKGVDSPSDDLTTLYMSWGQLVAHDMTNAGQPLRDLKCCARDGQPKSRFCLQLPITPDDRFYSDYNVTCIPYHYSFAAVRPNCALGPRIPLNTVTSTLDASFVYGSLESRANSLRQFQGGHLSNRDWFEREGSKPLLPAQQDAPELSCRLGQEGLACFRAGDDRANIQPQLTTLQTIYMREHNRLADKLAEINPHWSDEQLYQETRRIVAAGVQHVLISEYLPLLIGDEMTRFYALSAHQDPTQHPPSESHFYLHKYDPSSEISISVAFEAAAFRQGHTLVPGHFHRYSALHEFVASEQLRKIINRPFILYQPGALDEVIGGMINQPCQSFDPSTCDDISEHLFQPPDDSYGFDLAALNIERGRDQGLPGYNSFREWCGLGRVESFEQLAPLMANNTAHIYSTLYRHVDDIDLWSAGVSERKLPGASVGPTFACIIGRQFRDTRRGDRFWYENPNFPSSFSPSQLAELRKITLAKILCQNSDDLPTIQRWPMRLHHPVTNPRLRCEDLPESNLDHWRDRV